jgi:hypothetical protein
MTFNNKAELLAHLKWKLEHGDSLVELAEIWHDDADVHKFFPELGEVMERLDGAACEMIYLLGE